MKFYSSDDICQTLCPRQLAQQDKPELQQLI